jgi:hypothetical protein
MVRYILSLPAQPSPSPPSPSPSPLLPPILTLPSSPLVRNRSREIVELLSDLERVRNERRKAKANRNKYTGTGNDGMSFSSGGGGGRYGGFGSDSLYGGGGGGGGGGGESCSLNDTADLRD